jgi:cell division protein FtsL
MAIVWGDLSRKSRKWLKAGWLVLVGLVAVYVGAIQPHENAQRIAMQNSTGLGAVSSDSFFSPVSSSLSRQRIRGEANLQMAATPVLTALSAPMEKSDSREVVRTARMSLIVKAPAETSDKIRQLTEKLGGFLVSSEINGDRDASTAMLTIRHPTARFEEVQQEIRKLAVRIESEKVEAEDVTRQYVDEEASLRNLHAQELQYLEILKQAKTVKDTLEVSDKLNDVRGQIEREQAQHDALTKQVATVPIEVSLRAEADAQVFGLHWRPLYQLKLAAREGLDGLGDYTATMISFLFYLPTVLLWLITILVGAAIGWRVLRWAVRKFFASAKAA